MRGKFTKGSSSSTVALPSIAYSSSSDAVHMAVLWGAVALGAILKQAKGYEK